MIYDIGYNIPDKIRYTLYEYIVYYYCSTKKTFVPL